MVSIMVDVMQVTALLGPEVIKAFGGKIFWYTGTIVALLQVLLLSVVVRVKFATREVVVITEFAVTVIVLPAITPGTPGKDHIKLTLVLLLDP